MDVAWGFLVGLVCGLASGRRVKTPPLDVKLVCDRVMTRTKAGELVLERSRAALAALDAQMRVGMFQTSSLTALVQSVADLEFYAADLLGDNAQLMRELKEAFYGGSKAND